MTAVLHSIDDHRSPLAKMSRKELEYLARYEGRKDIEPGMAASLIRRRFEAQRPRQMPRPMRDQLGAQKRLVVPPYEQWVKIAFSANAPAPAQTTIETVDALDDLEQQWLSSKAASNIAQEPSPTDYSTWKMHELKAEVKNRGIKQDRRWKKDKLIEILHGQDAIERGQ